MYGQTVEERCWHLYVDGHKLERISAIVGVGVKTLERWRKKFGWKEKRNRIWDTRRKEIQPEETQEEMSFFKEAKERRVNNDFMESVLEPGKEEAALKEKPEKELKSRVGPKTKKET